MLVCIAPLSGALPRAPSQLGAPTQGGAEQAWQRAGVGSLGVAGEGCTCRCVWVCAGVCARVQACARMCGCVRMCVLVCAGACRCVQVSTAQPPGAGLWAGDPQPDPISALPSGRESPSCSSLSAPTPAPRGVWAVRQLSQEVGSLR